MKFIGSHLFNIPFQYYPKYSAHSLKVDDLIIYH